MIAAAQSPAALRFQGAWSAKDIFHEYALDFAKKVNDMTRRRAAHRGAAGGRGGQPQFELLDAVAKGVLDGGHGVLAYHYAQAAGLRAVGLGSRVRHGRQHAARVAQVRRRPGAARQALPVDRRERGVVSLRPDADRSRSAGSGSPSPAWRASRASGSAPWVCAADVFTAMGAKVSALPERRDRARDDPRPARCGGVQQRHARTTPSASRTCRRPACSRATTRTPSSSRSCSTRRSSTRCPRG